MIPAPAQSDRLGICNGVGIWVLTAVALAVLLGLGDILLRDHPHPDERVQLVQVFKFDRLSLVPSGSVRRLPGAPNPAGDWCYDPQLVGIDRGLAELILAVQNSPGRDAVIKKHP